MSLPNDTEERQRPLAQWQSSAEYQEACAHYQAQSARLAEIAAKLLDRAQELAEARSKNTARIEYGSQSTMHRGPYCPSPVFDLVVGNTQRGKILKRRTSRSNPAHAYGFDADGRLLWCDSLYEGRTINTEYLIYEENARYGITVSDGSLLTYVTEEIFENSHLVRYSYGLCRPGEGQIFLGELNEERYAYDAEGLCRSEWHRIMQSPRHMPAFLQGFADKLPAVMYTRWVWSFQRENGFLTAYTASDGQVYPVRVERKA